MFTTVWTPVEARELLPEDHVRREKKGRRMFVDGVELLPDGRLTIHATTAEGPVHLTCKSEARWYVGVTKLVAG